MEKILKNINKDALVLIDTSFGLSEGIVDLYQSCTWKFKEAGAKIVIPRDVVEEAKSVKRRAIKKGIMKR